MRRPLFVDTGGWLAVLDPRDQYHAPAKAFYDDVFKLFPRVVTTNLVVAETYISVLRNARRGKAISFLDIIECSRRIQCVWSDRVLETTARDILRRYADQDFSYTDAVSFAVMQHIGLTEAFAFDQHFTTMGFVRLPTGIAP